MLRSSGLKTAGRFYAFATATDLVVKLPSSRVSELIDSGRGLPCSPRPGRPMKEWVRIPLRPTRIPLCPTSWRRGPSSRQLPLVPPAVGRPRGKGIMANQFATIDGYIASFSDDVQAILEEVRRTIHTAVPAAGETISYQMPAITMNGSTVVFFAAWKRHLGIYPPVSTQDETFALELAPYRGPKGNLIFPLREPIPYDLIRRVVTLLVQQRTDSDD